jgi:hypothetical protein
MGIKKDIHLKGDDYQWLGSLFYFGAYVEYSSSGLSLTVLQVTWRGSIRPVGFSSVYP